MILCVFLYRHLKIFVWLAISLHCIALLHKLKLTWTRQIIDLEQVWYMYSIVLPYCCEHAWRNMAVWVVRRISMSLRSAYTHTVLFRKFFDIIFLWFVVCQKYYLLPFNLIIFIYYNCILARTIFINKMPRSAYLYIKK